MLGLAVCDEGYDFYILKCVVESLLSKTSATYKLERSKQPFLHPGISADIIIGDKVIGSFGKIHPQVAKNYDIPNNVFYAELNDDFLIELEPVKRVFKNISKYPIVERDLAVVVDEKVTAEEMLSAIKSSCGNLYYNASLFDVYRSASVG